MEKRIKLCHVTIPYSECVHYVYLKYTHKLNFKRFNDDETIKNYVEINLTVNTLN